MEQGNHNDRDYQTYLKSVGRTDMSKMTPKEKSRWRDIYRKYKLTPEQYEKMLKRQNNLCLGCGHVPKKICVDHDHKTGQVRGLLCSDCNFALGHAKDNPETLSNLSRYLKRHLKKGPERQS